MKAFTLRAAIVVAGLSLAAGSAWAQGDRGSAGGGGGGGDRGGGGGASAGGGGGNAGASSSGGFSGGSASSSASSGGGSSFGSAPSAGSGGSSFGSSQRAGSAGGFREVAPMHRSGFNYSESGASARAADGQQRAVPRSSGSSSSSGSSGSSPRSTASPAPRSNAGSSGSSGNATPRRTGGENNNNNSNANNSNPNREVPNWSRPRGNQPATGTAVTRTTPVPDRNGYVTGRYYDPYLFYGGLGFGFYDYYSPYYYPYGAWAGYGMTPGYGDPYSNDPYSYGAGYGSYSNSLYDSRNQGAIKLKVKPNNAKVYVDGYFVGYVNQFDGAFQKLSLNGGQHKVEVKADGYETSEFDVLVTPDKTVTFAGDLKKLQ
jgi:hypothetical protein